MTRTERAAKAIPISLNPHAIVIDENQEKVEKGEKRREVVGLFHCTRHGKRRSIEGSVT
jgi:hypothetical protein